MHRLSSHGSRSVAARASSHSTKRASSARGSKIAMSHSSMAVEELGDLQMSKAKRHSRRSTAIANTGRVSSDMSTPNRTARNRSSLAVQRTRKSRPGSGTHARNFRSGSRGSTLSVASRDTAAVIRPSPTELAAELKRVRAQHHAAAVNAIRAGKEHKLETLTDYTIRNQRMRRKLDEIREAAVPSSIICEAFLGMTRDEYCLRRSATLRLQSWWRGALLRLTLARMRRRGDTPVMYYAFINFTAGVLRAAGHSASPNRTLETLDFVDILRLRTAVADWCASGDVCKNRSAATALSWQHMLLDEDSPLRKPGLLRGGRLFGFRHAEFVECVATIGGIRRAVAAKKEFSLSEELLQRCVLFLAPPRAVNAVMRAQAPSTWLHPVVGGIDVTRDGFPDNVMRDCNFKRALAVVASSRCNKTADAIHVEAKTAEKRSLEHELARIGKTIDLSNRNASVPALDESTCQRDTAGGPDHPLKTASNVVNCGRSWRTIMKNTSESRQVLSVQQPAAAKPPMPKLPRIEVPVGTMSRWANRPVSRIDPVSLKRSLGLLDVERLPALKCTA